MNKPDQTASSQLMRANEEFPDISYEEFRGVPAHLRQGIIMKNRVISTDTYNRSMGHYKGPDYNREETYVLQMRVTPEDGYLIVYGIRKALEKTLARPILKQEVDFATEFYKRSAQIPYFNEEMWRDVLDKHGGKLPLDISAVPDGTAIMAADPVLMVRGPGELAAHFEPAFHRVFYPSLVATDAHRINRALDGNVRRFIEVGKRGTPNEEMHLDALEAAYVGGGINLTSNDSAVALHDEFRDVGTMGHRFVQFYNNEDEAFERAINASQSVSLLIDLIDSFKGIEKALILKKKYRESGKKIWIRLDSGDIKKQTIYILEKYRELGFNDSGLDKVVVEDLDTIEQIAEFERDLKEKGYEPDKYVVYGAGGMLITKNKQRSNASTGYKLSEVESYPKIKLSSSPGKESLPGKVRLVRDSDGQRIIEQVGEIASLSDSGTFNLEEILADTMQKARARVDVSFQELTEQKVWQERMKGKSPKTPLSAMTLNKKAKLLGHYLNDKNSADMNIYPMKKTVPAEMRSWDTAYPEYDAPYFVHDTVVANDSTVNPAGWADPEDVEKVDFSQRKTYETDEILFDESGMPLNPHGRKGLAGRGKLGKWGPNQAADSILTYRDGDQFKLLVIRRRDTGNLAFPGGFLDGNENAVEGALREVQEEAFSFEGDEKAVKHNKLNEVMSRARLVRAGYMDDYRNTDNAWIESSAFSVELSAEEFEALKPKAGDDAADAMWIDVNQNNLSELFSGHIAIFQKLLPELKK